ncbi:MAG: Asp23/Gls24 family envelope stress response protein [Thermoleophilia bacterium]|nr:Asp23/Gls24 family envelope stress response protein [Thermoleophilia bacterium]
MTEYLIATSVLEAIVRGAVENDERLRVHSALPLARTHAVEVAVDEDECRVTVHLDARLGQHLPSLAVEARQKIASALSHMTGLTVAGVDVVFSGVFPEGV